MISPQAAGSVDADRVRLSLDLAPSVAALLDHVSAVTGVPKSQICLQAVLEGLPALLERVDTMQKRAQALRQQSASSNKGKR